MKLLILTIILFFGSVFGKDKIRLEEISVLTLHKDKMTTGRRSSPVPQLACVGGSAGCGAATPDVVQCYNRGSDGYDIQWECKADLDNDYRFGRVEVQCEGYDYPTDKYILKGSCGLKYELELTEAGRERRNQRNHHSSHNSYQHHGSHNSHHRSYDNKKHSEWRDSWGLLGLIPIIGLIVVIYFYCLAPSTTSTSEQHPRATAPPPPPGFIYDDPPPPYNSAAGSSGAYQRSSQSPGCDNIYPDLSGCSGVGNAQQQHSGGGLFSGFWGGLGLGGLAGYLFSGSSNRNRGYYNSGYSSGYYNAPRSRWFDDSGSGGSSSGGFSGGFRRSSPSPPKSTGSTGSRMTSGFGGTSRR